LRKASGSTPGVRTRRGTCHAAGREGSGGG
jgi:hypothetical protein